MPNIDNIELYIKNGNNYIPFKSYKVKGYDGSESYYYLRKPEVKGKLINRWALMYHCGKKIIANEQTEGDGLEVTPNDIVALPYKYKPRRLSIMFLFILIFETAVWFNKCSSDELLINYFEQYVRFNAYVLLAYLLIRFGMYSKSFENKSDAKEWNKQIIPDDRLI